MNRKERQSVTDLKTKQKLKTQFNNETEAKQLLQNSKLLQTNDVGYVEAEGIEKTFKFTQEAIKDSLDLNTKSKMLDLKLDEFGPYKIDFTKNGKNLLIGGKKGHLATFNWRSGRLGCEIHLKETIRDVKWLHNETMFAVAQKKYTYIYDQTGMEIHCLRDHNEINKLDFLSHHFLLVTIGNPGYLKFRDTSTGRIVADHRTGLGRCDVMAQNPHNAIMHLGHTNGTVTLWSPSMTTPLVKMLCHRGPVKALAIDKGGYYMATAGMDNQMKVWDIRTYKALHEYYTPTPATALAVSDLGSLAVAHGGHITVWRDSLKTKAKSPYLSHLQPGSIISDLQFCPFEDILGFGHSKGYRNLIVPGTGEPNYDSLVANPYQTKSQRQETEVHSLLEKIQPEMISLNAEFIGQLDRAPSEFIKEERQLEYEANNPKEKFVPRNKKRGRSSAQKKFNRKQGNVMDETKARLVKKMEKGRVEREKRVKGGGEDVGEKKDLFHRFKNFSG